MMTVEQALESILAQKLPRKTETVALRHSLGRILADPVKADRDAPPFDRVSMDGIALQAQALELYSHFKIERTQAAGATQSILEDPTGCIEVMTGAILPANTDCVIPYEQIEIKEGFAYPLSRTHPFGQNIHRQGKDALQGDSLLPLGEPIVPTVAAVLASAGMEEIKVLKLPRMAICSTGDELVDIGEKPLPHQIRRSNTTMMEAALLEFGIRPDGYHLPDDQELMAKHLFTMVKDYDILLFSGAVSKGKYDFLPAVLEGLGMKKVVHGVAQRPGKPFLFGTFPDALIFGFPGNPVSTFVCFHLYFKPWLKRHLGLPNGKVSAVLGSEIVFEKPLTYHLLVSLDIKEGRLIANPVANSGSGDLVHLAQADALLSLPPEKERFAAGEVYPLSMIRKDLFYW